MSGTLTITIPPLFHVPAGRVLTQIYFKNLLLFNTSRMVVSQCFGTHFPAVRQACGRHLVWDVTFEWLPSCVMCYTWVAAIFCEVLKWPPSCVRCYIPYLIQSNEKMKPKYIRFLSGKYLCSVETQHQRLELWFMALIKPMTAVNWLPVT